MEDEVVFFCCCCCQWGRALCEKYCDVNCCQQVLASSYCWRLVPVGHTTRHIQLSTAHVWIPLTLCSIYLSILFESCIFKIFCKQACRFSWTVRVTDPFTTLIKMYTFSLLLTVMCVVFPLENGGRFSTADLKLSPHVYVMFVSLFSQFSAARWHQHAINRNKSQNNNNQLNVCTAETIWSGCRRQSRPHQHATAHKERGVCR